MDGGTIRPNAFAVAHSSQSLLPAERLLVWSFRRWAVGFRENSVHQWALVWREFRRVFGNDEAEPALADFATLFKHLMIHGRRPVHTHQPCCPCIGDDEAWLLGFIAACQRGHWLCARGLAEAMVEPDGVGDLLQAGGGLAARLRGRSLTMRRDLADAIDATAGGLTGTDHRGTLH